MNRTDQMVDQWVLFIFRNQKYKKNLLFSYEQLLAGKHYQDVKKNFAMTTGADSDIYGFISFIGRKMGMYNMPDTEIVIERLNERIKQSKEKGPTKPFKSDFQKWKEG